jgi:hypothetical protein
MSLTLLIALSAGCDQPPDPAAPTGDTDLDVDTSIDWEPPTFDGDGLPDPTDTDREDGRDDPFGDTFDSGDTGEPADSGAAGGGPVGALAVTSGMFATFGAYHIAGVTVDPPSCADFVAGGLPGVYVYYSGGTDQQLTLPSSSAFATAYDGAAFGTAAGTFGVRVVDTHYVDLRWDLDVAGAGELQVYNCGDAWAWLVF